MIGVVIGDIVGSKYELNNIKTKDFVLFSDGCSYTDDTIMTVAVAHWLMTSSHPQCLISIMRDYGKKYPFPQGGYGDSFARWLRDVNPLPYYSFGNGAAMRVSPVGMMFDDAETTEYMAGLTASITHDHPEGYKGAKSVAHAMWMARHSYSKEAIRDEIERIFDYDLRMNCDDIRPTYIFNETCQGTVPQAIVAFLDSTDFEDAIRNAVSLGGDSDTLAAITGGIAEAYYGVPDDIREKAMAYLPDEFKDIINGFYKSLNNNKL